MFNYPDLDAGQIAGYHEQGYLLIEQAVSADDASKLRDEILSIMRQVGLGSSKLRQTTQYLAGSALDSLVNSQRLNHVAGQLLGGEACLFMPFTAVKSAGGGGAFHFHQDNQYTEFDGPGINFWFALNEMTEENGCLWIEPRSHLAGTLPSVPSPDGDQHKTVASQPENAIPLLMNPGDCVAFSRLTIHGSGVNATADHRVGYAIQYHRADVRSRRAGEEEWQLLREHPRWHVGPVETIKADSR